MSLHIMPGIYDIPSGKVVPIREVCDVDVTDLLVGHAVPLDANRTSVMGASKRVAEHVVDGATWKAKPGQCFVSARFGNVLGTRSSVVLLFQ